ncbi:hypothetical protein [Neorhizobium sp. DAR64860/K0K1]|uniref:hypothetical protein n=1 Tax=Neorhizobium sp. DAR64860/K0K1 TaxID=3421955 RepID=UPI003D291647
MKHRPNGFKAALALTYLAVLAAPIFTAAPAAAVVYCNAVGVPKGCVVRPPAAVVVYCTAPAVPLGCVARPVARTAIYCTAPGLPVGCVRRPGVRAPGLGVKPVNRGGPRNRLGIR